MSPSRHLVLALCASALPLLAAPAAEATPANYFVASDVSPGLPVTGGALADVDADGRTDLLFGSYSDQGPLVLLARQAASGGFGAVERLPAGLQPNQLAVGDLDGDGWKDVAVATPGGVSIRSTTITLELGDASGTFTRRDVGTVTSPRAVVLGDLDGDSDQDIVVGGGYSGGLTVLMQGADGALTRTDVPTTSRDVEQIATGDFDGSGSDQIAYEDAGELKVIRWTGSGLSAPRTVFDGPTGYLGAGDVDGDGDPDLVITTEGGQTAILRPSAGAWTVSGRGIADGDYPTGPFTIALAVADVDGDGRDEVLTARRSPSVTEVTVQRRRADGSLAAIRSTPVAVPNVQSLATGDVDGDGRTDVLVSGGYAALLRGAFDAAPPVTRDDLPATSAPRARAITLTAEDAGAGVGSTSYEVVAADGAVGPTVEYAEGSKPVLQPGERLRYRSIDQVGNAEADRLSAVVGTRPPMSTTPTTPTSPAPPATTPTSPAPPATTPTSAAPPATTPTTPTAPATTSPVTTQAASTSPAPIGTPAPPASAPTPAPTRRAVICRPASGIVRIAVRRPGGRLATVRATLAGKRLKTTRTRTQLVARVDLRGRHSGRLRVAFVVRKTNGTEVTITARATYRAGCS